jgi:leucyl aminopeptidase
MRLKLSLRSAEPHEVAADVLVVGVYTFGTPKKGAATLEPLSSALGGGLDKLIAKEEFTGKKDQTLSIPTLGRLPFSRVLVVGLGERGKIGAPEVRTFAAKAARAANAEKGSSLTLGLPEGLEAQLRAAGEGLELGAYRFTKYLSGDRKPKAELARVTVVVRGKVTPDARRQLELGQRVGAAVNVTRDLGNEPPNVMTPAALAQAAQKVARENGIKAVVFDMREIQRRGMKLIQAVGQGSQNEPRFVHMTYTPARKAKKKIVFVGKGITFDTGGISIKPAAGMGEMKADMSGAGNMVGLMAAIGAVKPNVEVHAIMACAENMPDGASYRPGDVWGSYDGKTVEIVNTDAEGRLLLADALAYARALKPDLLIDNATLTGACVVALGPTCSGFYATNEETAELFGKAVKASGETMWRMPLLEDLREQIKSEIADVKQAGDRYGGSITATLFLREFIGDVKNWVHADIAGPALADRALGWSPKGATGHGVLTFLSIVESSS